MDRQVVRWTNAPAQTTQSKDKIIETLFSKSHECNTLAQENQRLAQENATFRLQLHLSAGARGPVNGTPESRFQSDNLEMRRYITELHGKQGGLNKTIEEQQDIIESLRMELTDLRTKIRHARDFLDKM